jgi:hypothetical protein
MQLFFGAVSATVRPRSFFPPIRSREEPASGRRSASEITEADDERVAAAAIIELDTWPFAHARPRTFAHALSTSFPRKRESIFEDRTKADGFPLARE